MTINKNKNKKKGKNNALFGLHNIHWPAGESRQPSTRVCFFTK